MLEELNDVSEMLVVENDAVNAINAVLNTCSLQHSCLIGHSVRPGMIMIYEMQRMIKDPRVMSKQIQTATTPETRERLRAHAAAFEEWQTQCVQRLTNSIEEKERAVEGANVRRCLLPSYVLVALGEMRGALETMSKRKGKLTVCINALGPSM